MKSVIIRDKVTGKVLIRLVHRKDHTIGATISSRMVGTIELEIRDDKGCKILWRGERAVKA
jgi:hypothetical protein